MCSAEPGGTTTVICTFSNAHGRRQGKCINCDSPPPHPPVACAQESLMQNSMSHSGTPGPKGDTGDRGEPGTTGDRGQPGAKGERGEAGLDGNVGERVSNIRSMVDVYSTDEDGHKNPHPHKSCSKLAHRVTPVQPACPVRRANPASPARRVCPVRQESPARRDHVANRVHRARLDRRRPAPVS